MKKSIKTETINLRVTKKEKETIQRMSSASGMSMSKYLTYIGINKPPIVINGGKELAAAIYEVNQNLNQLEKFPLINVQQLRDIISDGIKKINIAKGEISNVHTDI